MKFLCERCKAKYQISDEKIAGRTVRMKCRKCGHLIEVEASVTETSVASRLPTAEKGSIVPGEKSASAERSATSAPSGAQASPAPPKAPPGPPPRKPPTASPAGAPAAPRPGAVPAAGGIPRPGAIGAPAPSPSRVSPPGAPSGSEGAALAGAFNRTVTGTPKELPSSVSAAMEVLSGNASAEEWYVGINGVPVGPVRLSELRRKAATGAITEDSLVWREGFEEWVPLRTFPELKALLGEATAAGRTSLAPAPPAPPPARNAAPAAPSVTPAPVAAPAIGTVPSAPARLASPVPVAPGLQRLAPAASRPAAAARSNVVSINSRLATAEKLEIEPSPSAPSLPVEAESGAGARSAAMAHAPAASAPPAAASIAAAAPVTASARADALDDDPRISSFGRRPASTKRIHPAAWAMVGLVGVLIGMGGAFVLVSSKAPPSPTVQVVTVPVPAPTGAAPVDSAPQPTTIGAVEVAAGPSTPKTGGGATVKATNSESKPSGGSPAPVPVSTSLSGLAGLVGGPKVGPNTSGPSGGGQLNSADVERVVNNSRGLVKRQCWEPALAGRAAGAPNSARVTVALTIAPDGKVSSADATGGDGYPGLANCVEERVKGWRFPPSEGGPVSIPFVFAAQ